MISVCVKNYLDELLYGWLIRLMECNGFPNMYSFQSFHFHMSNGTSLATGKTRLDWISGLEQICREYESIISFPDIETMIERMTGTLTVFPFLSYGHQALRSQIMLRSDEMYRMQLEWDVERLCVCTECMKEDIKENGEAYYHTWHHLLNVHVCAKHGAPLKKIRHNGRESLWNPGVSEQAEEIPRVTDIETECMISRFMKKMYEKPVTIDLKILQSVIAAEMERKGYPTEIPYGSLPEKIHDSGFGKIFGDNIVKEIRCILTGSWINKEKAAALLTFLFKEYENFYIAAQERSNNLEVKFRELAVNRCIKLLSFRGWIAQLQCPDCGRKFWIHPYAVALGCGCPECEQKLSETEFIGRQMMLIGDGQYEIAEPFRGYGTKIKILHKTCGKVRYMRPANLIWMGRECRCMYDVTMEKLQARIDPGRREYKLVHYRGEWGRGQIATIRHEICGNTFDVQLSYFIKNPYCRACRPRNYSTERFRQDMRALTGDEYTISGEFINQRTKIKIMHKKCGIYTDGLPSDFLNGKRCSLCSKFISEEDIKGAVKECTEGRYSVIGREKTDFIIADPSGKSYKMTARKIMQELIRPTPSKFFPDRVCQAEVPIRTAATIYIEGRVICKKQSKFSYQDFQMYSRTDFSNAVKWLIKQKYVKHVEYGKYMTLPETKEKNI